jgi:hypothetical protein
MGLRPTHGDENLQFRTAANRAGTVRSGNDLANFKRFFNGVVSGRRRTDDHEWLPKNQERGRASRHPFPSACNSWYTYIGYFRS